MTTITIDISDDVGARLAQLADDTHRPAAHLAAEAVASYVAREQADIEGIKRGLADVAAGRLIPHDEAMAELEAAIEAAIAAASAPAKV